MKTSPCASKNAVRSPVTHVNKAGSVRPAERQMRWSSQCVDAEGNKEELTRRRGMSTPLHGGVLPGMVEKILTGVQTPNWIMAGTSSSEKKSLA